MVLLLDGLSLLYRTWTRPAPSGVAGGLYGFAALVSELLREERPLGLAIALDGYGPTVRQLSWAAYKAHRAPAPEELRSQIALVSDFAEALGAPLHRVDGQEADDVLATLATRIPGPVRIVTADTDLFQLIDDRVTVRFLNQKTRTRPVWDRATFREHHPFAPDLLPTFKAMTGDPSDNLPGVPGLGRPTANRLCCTHGDAAGILAALDEKRIGNRRVPPLLAASRELLLRQEALGRLDRTVPVAEPLHRPVDEAGLARWLASRGFSELRVDRSLS